MEEIIYINFAFGAVEMFLFCIVKTSGITYKCLIIR